MSELLSVAETNFLIDAGKRLHIAGDECVLRQLNRGTWIGGTTPYFITDRGGLVEREKLFVTPLPDYLTDVATAMIDIGHIPAIITEAPRHGFTLAIIPGFSDIHTAYGLTADGIPGIHDTPVVGWVSGVHLSELDARTPKVFDGATGEGSDHRMVVLRATLPQGKIAEVGRVNVYVPGQGDEIVFRESAFSARDCTINGQAENFHDYVVRTKLNTELPLVTELSGHNINVSFRAVDAATRSVTFYAPVMKEHVYRLATLAGDYRETLVDAMKKLDLSPVFACNCILSYRYGRLEGEKHIPVPGPATFGELAHMLVNQTLVYLSVRDK